MTRLENIELSEALALIADRIPRLPAEWVSLMDLYDRILAEDIVARVDSPSVDAALKDGYAVHSEDLASADPDRPAILELGRMQVAGDHPGAPQPAGTAIKVTTGAPLPPGATGVLAQEFAEERDGRVFCYRDAGIGRNVLPRGIDVHKGQVIAQKGERLHPSLIGLMAAAGLEGAMVTRRPRISVISTGDEVVAPGRPLPQGKLFASNLVEALAWLKSFGFPEVRFDLAPDHAEKTMDIIKRLGENTDAFISTGGAWGSEKDLMLNLLDQLGWEAIFHRVRLGPGKAAGFGLLDGRPFFILPGGPPSFEAAFLIIALNGLMAMSGVRGPVFPKVTVCLQEDAPSRSDWTQVIHLEVWNGDQGLAARPVQGASRLSTMARKNALLLVPEGVSGYRAGSLVEAMLLIPGPGWPVSLSD